MTRLQTAVRWEMRLQFRQGFYYAAAFIAIIMTIVLWQFPRTELPTILPIFVLGNMTIGTFYFMAGLVLLEKGDGVLEGLIVSPLRQSEYLAAKVISLTLLTLVENVAIVTAVYGLNYNLLLLLLGLGLMAGFNVLFGFIAVARYDSINRFLMPSVLITMTLTLPLLDYLGLWSSPLLYLHPVQATLLLLKGAFQPIATWQIVYGVVYAALWIGLLFKVSQRIFYRFIILQQA
ncbi:ABC transporter permease [Candidatus Leptofilum sp.]|uniref:fluoroquinolone export ABC transporter permease subunit n=1 Tax=Candidatus Leptofilum sp. TaxID=3241576 RepID=UPI003B59E1E3